MSLSREQYIAQYAECAMRQMEIYGIPASITLAQAIIESGNGNSRLARNENNHFGIKASSSWLKNGGEYALYTDDRPDEKFCKYESVAESYEHHSKVLKGKRYSECFNLPPDDYRGWAQGLQKAGYASDSRYAATLISVIEKNDLQKFDRQVLAQTQSKNGSLDYSFPLKRSEFLFVTSPFGMRKDPLDHSKEKMHRGIDIRCDKEAVLVTENAGKVIKVNQDANADGGKSVTIEYGRSDGSKIQATYMHLSSIDVSVGQTVNAGDALGVSGNTGARSTGPHLHFEVATISADGKRREIDPASYLGEISQKANIELALMHDGEDILEKYSNATESNALVEGNRGNEQLSPDEWMKKLLSSEDSGVALASSGDPVIELATMLFSSLMVLAMQIDSKEEQMAIASEAASERKINLSPLAPGMEECEMLISEGRNPIIVAKANGKEMQFELSSRDVSMLNMALSDSSLSPEQKQQRVSNLIDSRIASLKLSQSYELALAQSIDENQGLQYK